ncbi:uncharacterized protein LOC124352958 [Homalodisca vitripennis]|uniref:uncharacterized protein LOC124352958 n=1 Tax=Homalodisca vitripennis TaxID=197043 RepID=UPI001EEC84F8|nr:uncharacterized protein LOC124352958 [Homalodisca vitripennis]
MDTDVDILYMIHHMTKQLPAEATAFLGAVAAFLVLLLVFFLYFNKKWCFYAVACCDDPPPISSSAKELGKAYRCEEQETSSDSEEDVLRRLQTSQSLQSTRLLADSLPGPSARLQGGPVKGTDLMSLAEKGKAGRAGSSASSSCSTTSGEDDGHSAGMRHRDARRYAKQISVDEEIAPLVSNANSQDCIVVLGQEPLFDVTDLQSMGTVDMARCGAVEVAFAYDAPMRKMTVHVLQARDIPTKDRGGATHTQRNEFAEMKIQMIHDDTLKHFSQSRLDHNRPIILNIVVVTRLKYRDIKSMLKSRGKDAGPKQCGEQGGKMRGQDG